MTTWEWGGQSGQTLLRGQERQRWSWPSALATGNSDKSHLPKVVDKEQLVLESLGECGR